MKGLRVTMALLVLLLAAFLLLPMSAQADTSVMHRYDDPGELNIIFLSTDGSVTPASAPTTLHPSDVAALNNIVRNNGLNLSLHPADGSWYMSDWIGHFWVGPATDGQTLRVYALDFDGFPGLRGTMDVSGLTYLTELFCSHNNLTGLNVSGCARLEILSCWNTNISSLDVSGSAGLKLLYVGNYDIPYPLRHLKLSGGREIRVDAAPGDGGYAGIADYDISRHVVELWAEPVAGLALSHWTVPGLPSTPVSGGSEAFGWTYFQLPARSVTATAHFPPVVSLNNTVRTVPVRGTYRLRVTVSPASVAASVQSISWRSSNTKIATVSSSGQVRGVRAGRTTVTATVRLSNGEVLTERATIFVGRPVTGIRLNSTSQTLRVGRTFNLRATVVPSNAANKRVTWTSSDPCCIATVNSSGKVTAVGVGTATITATTQCGRRVARCRVTVRQ